MENEFETVENFLYALRNAGSKFSLDRIKLICANLENPQENFPKIHVAGTNGKGSVCAMLESILRCSGLKVGMFTSPHLISMRERFRIDGVLMEENEFVKLFCFIQDKLQEVRDAIAHKTMQTDILPADYHPTFFEYLFFMAMLWFEEKGVDYIVLETGLGGRLDATNVFDKPQLTIITEIGLDHCQYLGDTKEQIAGEKAGIIKPGVPLVYVDREKAVSEVLSKEAKRCGSRTFAVDKTRISNVNINIKSKNISHVFFIITPLLIFIVFLM